MEGRYFAKYSFLFVASSALVFAFFWTPPAGLVAFTKETSLEAVSPVQFRIHHAGGYEGEIVVHNSSWVGVGCMYV